MWCLYIGMFHGEGVLKYPDGSKVSGVWNKGKITSSKFVFPDGLEFEQKNWKYCTCEDRRFYIILYDIIKTKYI